MVPFLFSFCLDDCAAISHTPCASSIAMGWGIFLSFLFLVFFPILLWFPINFHSQLELYDHMYTLFYPSSFLVACG